MALVEFCFDQNECGQRRHDDDDYDEVNEDDYAGGESMSAGHQNTKDDRDPP